jgi:hypothetical protein
MSARHSCAGYMRHLVRYLTGRSTTEDRWGLERDPSGHGAYLEPKGKGEMSMPRKRLRTKTLSPMCRKTCEHGERVSLEPTPPLIQLMANRRASEAVPAPTRFERMEANTLRCEGSSGNEPDEGDEWAPPLGFPYCAYGTWDSLRKETSGSRFQSLHIGCLSSFFSNALMGLCRKDALIGCPKITESMAVLVFIRDGLPHT